MQRRQLESEGERRPERAEGEEAERADRARVARDGLRSGHDDERTKQLDVRHVRARRLTGQRPRQHDRENRHEQRGEREHGAPPSDRAGRAGDDARGEDADQHAAHHGADHSPAVNESRRMGSRG